jgi:predicted GH43/DUF377 family glycosyl hydrolase
MTGASAWNAGRVGGGCPPILTDAGWLEIYHGNDKTPGTEGVGAYFGATLLMDKADPTRVIGASDGPVMAPETDFEVTGFVPNVIFPTAAVHDGDLVLVYYGAADTCTGVTGLRMADLLESCNGLEKRGRE